MANTMPWPTTPKVASTIHPNCPLTMPNSVRITPVANQDARMTFRSVSREAQAAIVGPEKVAVEFWAFLRKERWHILKGYALMTATCTGSLAVSYVLNRDSRFAAFLAGIFACLLILMAPLLFFSTEPERISRSQGNEAENWTATELKKTKVLGQIRNLTIGGHEVDSAAVTASEVLAIETK